MGESTKFWLVQPNVFLSVRTCACGVMSHPYRNKLHVAEKGEGYPGGQGPGGRSGGTRHLPGVQGRSHFWGVSLPLVAVQ